MRNTHKNGPWQTFESCGETFIISAGDPSSADTVAKIWHAKYHPTRAQLIAAAPELLEALEGLHKALARMIDKYDPDSKEAEWLQHSNEAIRKARGL